jgi:hypothetical protein
MSDTIDDGATTPADDAALFNAVTSGKDIPETPEQVTPPPAETPPATTSAPQESVGARELREAYERSQRRERELERQIAEFSRTQQPPEKPKRPDVFENPDAFLQHGVQEAIDPVKSEIESLREFYSRRDAIREHGPQKVQSAYNALDQASRAGDPEAQATVDRIRKSMDPFGDIVTWHDKQTAYKEFGADPAAYRAKLRAELLKDPEFLKEAQGSARTIATQTGNTVNRPAVSSIPSLTRVGAAALPDGQDEPSDAELFASATRRKRAG